METQKIRAILTGATGMVGEGVLHECLHDPDVESVLIINRRPSGIQHNKLKEIIHADFFDLSPIEGQLSGYNTCFFCLGVSSIGLKEPEFTRLTYTLTMHVAETLARLNPDMVFTYISGARTDSTEKGSVMWARVKGRTENDLMRLPFKKAYAFRPGYMHPTPGLKNVLKYYKYITWMYPLLKNIFPASMSTLADLGHAMIEVALHGYDSNIIEVTDIKLLAKRRESVRE